MTAKIRHRIAQRRWRKNNPEKARSDFKKWYIKHGKDHKLRRAYGINLAQYHAMLTAQNNGCKICRTKTPGANYKKLKYFQVDHCHVTGKIRGLLCNTCNRALGLFKDSLSICKQAVIYLEGK